MNPYYLLSLETHKMIYNEFKERETFSKIEKYHNEISFDTFVSLLEDYYTIEYSGKLNRTTFLVFKFFLILTRYDGFVKISYDEFIDKFCCTGAKIGKTTLRNCVQELVDKDLICSMETSNVLENGSYLNGSKIYGIVDKSNVIYQLCDIKLLHKQADIFTLLDMYKRNLQKKKYLFNVDDIDVPVDEKPKTTKKKKKSNLSDKTRYKALMKTLFKNIKPEMEEFFDFLGSYNKTGQIALSRKVKILDATKHYADEDIIYAMNLTMRNTLTGNNPYRERYFLKILRNLYDEDADVEVNEKATELSKKADEKLKQKNNSSVKSKDDLYRREIERLRTISGYYQECLSKYKDSSDAVQKKLYKVAKGIERKMDAFDSVYDNVCKRERLLQTIGWNESITNDRKWNNLIVYTDSDGNKVSKEVAVKKMKELGITPAYTKYDIFV